MDDCIFCKIVKKEAPAKIEYENDSLIVIKDVNPKAPVHLLIIPKKHIRDIKEDSGIIWASVGKLAVEIAQEKGLMGFRMVHNVGTAALVKHMHVHFLAEVDADRDI